MDIKINTKSLENRPNRLMVVCILSWIYIGINFVVSLYHLFSGPVSKTILDASEIRMKSIVLELRNSGLHWAADLSEKLHNMTAVLNDHHYEALFLTLGGLVLGFLGVGMMFLGKKTGFHLYIIYSIFSIGQLYLFFSASEIPSMMTWYEISLAGIFIWLYATNLKWMK